MASELPIRQHFEPIAKIITDLDLSEKTTTEKSRKTHRHNKEKRDSSSKLFPNRSKSAGTKSDVGYFRVLLQAKDEQIEKLVEKIANLHNYNNQFAQENERLHAQTLLLTENVQSLNTRVQTLENQKCSLCSEWINEKEELLTANTNLKNDVNMMKTLVYRLNVQLERHQDKIRKLLPNVEETELVTTTKRDYLSGNLASNDAPLSPIQQQEKQRDSFRWGSVNIHTLGPLLNAYEEAIREKDDLIYQHEKEINRFTGNLKEIIQENERLQVEMDDLRKGKDGWREEKTRLQAQLDICRSKAELQTKRADLAKEKLVEVLRCYEQKVQAQALDIERLQDAYSRTKGEIASMKNLQSQPEAFAEGLKEYQKLFDDLKKQYETEKAKISQELIESKKENINLNERLTKIHDENISLRTSVEKFEKEFEDFKLKNTTLKQQIQEIRESKARLKSRLKIALQWARKLEEGREKVNKTWNDLRELERLVRHKEAQIRGLHARHTEEIEKLQRKLEQREDTIRTILMEKTKEKR